jgi:hypothetical protein
MTAYSLSTAVELTKRLYPDGIDSILYEDSPAWGMVKKWKKFNNEAKFLVWKFATGGGASSVFSNAQANKGVASFKRPLITRVREYALASMDGEMLDATDGQPAALAETFKVAMDDALYNINRSLGFQAFRNGGGARAQLASSSSGVATTTITLSSTSSMQGLEKGMYVNAASTDGTSGSVLAGKALITAVDRGSRTLTTTAAWNTLIPGITDSYYLFRDGDFGNVIKGFQAWIPDAAPSPGENFFGIDRSSDTRLHGLRYAPTSGNIEEVLINASAVALDNGSRPDLVILNPLDMANLVNQLGSKRTIPVDARSADKPTIGYRGVMINGAGGPITVLSDPMCQRLKAWMLTQATWEDWCLGEVPRILNRDGQETLREASADADELRVGGYMQRVCLNPNANVNITLPAAA